MTNEEKLRGLPKLIEGSLGMAFVNACELAKSITTIKKLMTLQKELRGEPVDETQEEIEEHLQHCIVILEREMKS
jgi:hypothetical protein